MSTSVFSSILSSLQSSALVSFTNENTGAPCWTDANVKEVEIESSSENSDQPLSTQQVSETSVFTGLLAADVKTNKIINPNRLRVIILTDNISLIEGVFALFADPTVTISVTSKSIVSSGMAIAGVRVDQTSDMLSAARLTITLEQIQPPQQQTYDPSQQADQSSLGLGVQTLSQASPSLTTTGNGIGSLVTSSTTAVGTLYQRFINNIGL